MCGCVYMWQLPVEPSFCLSAQTTCLMGGILRTEKMTLQIHSMFMVAANWRGRERHSDTAQVCLPHLCLSTAPLPSLPLFLLLSLSFSLPVFLSLHLSLTCMCHLSMFQVRWSWGFQFCLGMWSQCLRVRWPVCGSGSRSRQRAALWITASRGSPPTLGTLLLSAESCLREQDRYRIVCLSEGSNWSTLFIHLSVSHLPISLVGPVYQRNLPLLRQTTDD